MVKSGECGDSWLFKMLRIGTDECSFSSILNYPFYGPGNAVAEDREKNSKMTFWAKHGHCNHAFSVAVDGCTGSV